VAKTKYSPEVRERAVRVVREHLTCLLREQYDDPVYGSISLDEFISAWADDELGAPLPKFVLSSPQEYLSQAGYVRRLGQLREWSLVEAEQLAAVVKAASLSPMV
jgi:hypothetical protein